MANGGPDGISTQMIYQTSFTEQEVVHSLSHREHASEDTLVIDSEQSVDLSSTGRMTSSSTS